jgi:formylglycine-generating enzyme required for sulfatase activity
MELVLIPAGTFYASASNFGDVGQHSRQVTLTQPYYISSTEVTCGEYRREMGSLPAGVKSSPGDGRLPVDYVSRDEAVEFCKRLSDSEGRHYRLPTEAEWENACRADTITSSSAGINAAAWFAGNAKGQLHLVASKQPNNWGLYDMEGNVSEWCADQFVEHVSDRKAVDPSAPPRPNSPGVIRGGDYEDSPAHCSAAVRARLLPEEHLKGVGFRITMDVPTVGIKANR